MLDPNVKEKMEAAKFRALMSVHKHHHWLQNCVEDPILDPRIKQCIMIALSNCSEVGLQIDVPDA